MAERADLVTIGGGLAGMAAALRAAELGLRVVVLEQGDGSEYACNTRISGGTLHIAYRSPYESRDNLLAALERVTFGNADPALAALLADHGRPTVDWLRERGAEIIELDAVAGVLPQVALVPLGAVETGATTGK